MIVINNKSLLEDYCRRYDIASHFTCWDALTKKLVRYEKGEIIALYGEKTDKLFFLVKGTIKFCCITDNFEEYFFFDAKNDGLFGEVEYVLKIPSITQSEVIDECDCIVIPIEENRHILDNDLKFHVFVNNILAQKYNEMRSIYMNKETCKLDVRLAKYITKNKNDDYISDLVQISKTVRCSYRQLLRIIKNFSEQGWIERLPQKGKYKILNRKALEALVDEWE